MTECQPPADIDTLRFINPDGLADPTPNGFSQLAVFPANWRTILVSGQGGGTADGSLSHDFATQVEQSLANVGTALAAGGARMRDVAKSTILVVGYDREKFRIIRTAIGRVWDDTAPAMTLIPVPALARDGMLIEIEVIAVVPV